jgi:hypothetical protein
MPPATPLVLHGNTVLMHEPYRNEQTREIFVSCSTYLKGRGTTSNKLHRAMQLGNLRVSEQNKKRPIIQ